MSQLQINSFAGRFIAKKVREQVEANGAQRAAANLRKHGYPISLALLLIVGRV